jgi:hypothetical protein
MYRRSTVVAEYRRLMTPPGLQYDLQFIGPYQCHLSARVSAHLKPLEISLHNSRSTFLAIGHILHVSSLCDIIRSREMSLRHARESRQGDRYDGNGSTGVELERMRLVGTAPRAGQDTCRQSNTRGGSLDEALSCSNCRARSDIHRHSCPRSIEDLVFAW